jgi:ABC-type dipeptide/oligopeptide/nickel transport system permease subunit
MSDSLLAPETGGDGSTSVAEREGMTVEGRSLAQQAWLRFRRHKLAIASTVVLVLIALIFLLGPILSPFTVEEVDVVNRLQGPGYPHFFGTDSLGRDLFVRTVDGGRVSLLIAVVVSLLTTFIGTLVGALSGYFGGWVDTVLSQLINLFLIVPALVILIVVGRQYGGSPISTALLLGVLLWPSLARIVRGLFLQFKNQEFVLAAKAAGAKAPRIMFRHILPNTVGPIVVSATLLVGTAIILESTLSFLGLGVQAPDTTLGTLVDDARGALNSGRPYELLLPASFIVGITLGINFLGDALRDALDPTSGRS